MLSGKTTGVLQSLDNDTFTQVVTLAEGIAEADFGMEGTELEKTFVERQVRTTVAVY